MLKTSSCYISPKHPHQVKPPYFHQGRPPYFHVTLFFLDGSDDRKVLRVSQNWSPCSFYLPVWLLIPLWLPNNCDGWCWSSIWKAVFLHFFFSKLNILFSSLVSHRHRDTFHLGHFLMSDLPLSLFFSEEKELTDFPFWEKKNPIFSGN